MFELAWNQDVQEKVSGANQDPYKSSIVVVYSWFVLSQVKLSYTLFWVNSPSKTNDDTIQSHSLHRQRISERSYPLDTIANPAKHCAYNMKTFWLIRL